MASFSPMTLSTEKATPPKSTKSRHPQSSVQIEMKPKSELEFVPRDSEESEFLDLMDYENVAFSLETVIPRISRALY